MFSDIRVIKADIRNKLRRKGKMKMSDAIKERDLVIANLPDKKSFIVEILDVDVNTPTRDIIKEYEEYSAIWFGERKVLSMRYVQKARKWYKEEFLPKFPKVLKNKNVKEGENMDHIQDKFGLERQVVKMANEGSYSVQVIANHLAYHVDNVKDALKKHHKEVTVDVYDEDAKHVYFISVDAAGVTMSIDGVRVDEDEEDVFDVKNELKEEIVVENESPEEEEEDAVEEANFDGNDNYWEVEVDCVEACSKAPNSVEVIINILPRKKALNFMKWAKAREWLAYLVGKIDDKGVATVTDLYLPDQQTSATLVDKVNANDYNKVGIIGVIHSHHEMGTGDDDRPSFSGHDAEFINGNHNISLLAGRDRKTGNFKIVGIARVKTPCGALMKVNAKVKYEKEEPTEEEKELKQEFIKKAFNGQHQYSNQYNKNVTRFYQRGKGPYHFS